MNIAIDITSIPSGSRKGGVTSYVFNLLKELQNIDKENRYYVFIKHEDLAYFNRRTENFHFVECDVKSKVIRLLWEQVVLPKYLVKYDIEVLHSPHYTIPFLVDKRIANVVTFHDMTFFLMPEKHLLSKRVFFRTFIPRSAKKADSIICVSRNTANDLNQILDIDSSKVNVVPHGLDSRYRVIDDEKGLAKIRAKYATSDEFIFYLGTLEPRKNVDGLIRAFAQLVRKERIRHKLVIGGEKGWGYEQLFRMVRELGIEEHVSFAGFVSEDDLPLLYNAADLFVYPSLYEGFGFPVLEAMACGTPVVSSNVSSIPEVVGSAGLLVDPTEDEAIARAVHDILTDSDNYKRLRHLGLQRAKKFSWHNTANETLRIYRESFRRKNPIKPFMSGKFVGSLYE